MSPTSSRRSSVPVLAAASVLATSLALTACTARLPPLPEDPRYELADVPFFPQTIHQCGPAALATVLGATGAQVTPEQLAPQVYIPGRRGSLQVEMVAAARSHGRLAYVLDPNFDALRAELAADRPVLVLQDLGALGIRRWHFAVVIGIDDQRDLVILRSGTERRRLERRERFLRSWQGGSNWAAVVTPATQPPATATGAGFIRALSSTERYLDAPTIDAAHAAALARWPADPLVLFASANQAYAAGRIADATARYRALLTMEPGHVAARNNLANALLDSGCASAARVEAQRAAGLVEAGSPLAAAVADTVAKATLAAGTAAKAGVASACSTE